MTAYLSFALPADDAFPAWTEKLKECQRVGDSYRGYVTGEEDLEEVLVAHSRQTGTTWSTRQTPGGLGGPSSRIMWKSQYVPYDGVPFINMAQRAVVMECQLGRTQRKHAKREALLTEMKDCPSGIPAVPSENAENDKKRHKSGNSRVYVSCPATVTVKEVKKFPKFTARKEATASQQRRACEKCVKALREFGRENVEGKIRWYVQLPTEKAHEFHEMDIMLLEDAECGDGEIKCELDPRITGKVRELIMSGITEFRQVRLALSKYVVDELFADCMPPSMEDLRFFPTDTRLQSEMVAVGRELEKQRLATTQLIGSQRIDARVLTKLRQLVVHGVTDIQQVKHAIKDFVEKELFAETEERPDLRDRAFYPTVVDIQNHLRVAQETAGKPIISTDVFAQVGATAVVEGLTQDPDSVAGHQPVVYVPAQWLMNASQTVTNSQSMVLMPTVIQWQLGGAEKTIQTDEAVGDSQVVPVVSSSSEAEATTVSSTVSEDFVSMDTDSIFASTSLASTNLGVNCVGDIPSLSEFTDETSYTQGSVDDSDLIGGCGQALPLTESGGSSLFSVSDRVVTPLTEIVDDGIPIRDVSLVQHGDVTPITSPRTFSPGPGDGCTDAEYMEGDSGGLGTSDDVVSGFYGTSGGFSPPSSSQSDYRL